ncbi:MAG: hypothetical protein OXC54_09695, partial [Rhodospirillaceae bacterium]|nr:hypothetical protein [Rhodospirillaceae bacterium]
MFHDKRAFNGPSCSIQDVDGRRPFRSFGGPVSFVEPGDGITVRLKAARWRAAGAPAIGSEEGQDWPHAAVSCTKAHKIQVVDQSR